MPTHLPPCAKRFRPHLPAWCGFPGQKLLPVLRTQSRVFVQVQPAYHSAVCEDESGGAVVSFMTCDAARNSSVELRIGGKQTGDIQHAAFAPYSTDGFETRQVTLPLFKGAVAAAAADVTIVITTTGCDGTQSMRSTIDVQQLIVSPCQ